MLQQWLKPDLSRRALLRAGAGLIAMGLARPECHADPPVRSLTLARMPFAKAARIYAGEKYRSDGYVDRQGAVRNGGLGCSAYVSVVLHRMRDGEDWLNHYDVTVHEEYGDQIAEHFGLQESATISATNLLDSAEVKSLISKGTLRARGLYLFNVRHGVQGHVGFVRVNSDGGLTQSHYSSLASINGLATGDFRTWLENSQYHTRDVELYFVLEAGE